VGVIRRDVLSDRIASNLRVSFASVR
jgi:hypothetical protein